MKKPYLNALAATLYIIVIVLVINFVTKILVTETIVIPMVMLSLFVLSAAIMGYLFVMQPLRMYKEGEKEQAIKFFGQTIVFFAIFTAILVAVLFITSLL